MLLKHTVVGVSKGIVEVIWLQGSSMNKRRSHFLLLIYVALIVGIVGCLRKTPAEKTGT